MNKILERNMWSRIALLLFLLIILTGCGSTDKFDVEPSPIKKDGKPCIEVLNYEWHNWDGGVSSPDGHDDSGIYCLHQEWSYEDQK